MVERIEIDDYTDADGDLDLDAYTNARVAVGEACERCGQGIYGTPSGSPDRCFDCRRLEKATAASVTHWKEVRCPECLHVADAVQFSDFVFQVDSIHWENLDASCPQCGAEFQFERRVSVSFESPPAKQSAGAMS